MSGRYASAISLFRRRRFGHVRGDIGSPISAPFARSTNSRAHTTTKAGHGAKPSAGLGSGGRLDAVREANARLGRGIEEDRHPQLVRIHGAVSLGVVRGGDIHLARSQLGVRDWHQLVATLHQCRHKAGFAIQHGVVCHVAEGHAYELVDEVWVAGAQVVGEVRRDCLLAGAPLDLVGKRLGHARLLAVAVCIRFAIFLHFVAPPAGAFAEHDQRVVARVCAFLLDKQLDELVEIDFVFGNDTADRGDVRAIERRKPRIAAEDAEYADPLVRGDCGPLALDGIGSAGDRRREADAVLGVANVVIHGLWNCNDPDAKCIELSRVAERVITADGNEVVNAERREVRQHLLGDVPGLGGSATRSAQRDRKVLGSEVIRQLLQFGWVGAAGVQHGPTAPVDGARVLTVEFNNVAASAGRVVQVQVRQRFPAATKTYDLDIVLAAAVGNGLYDRVEAGHVAATGENADALFVHDHTLTSGAQMSCRYRSSRTRHLVASEFVSPWPTADG